MFICNDVCVNVCVCDIVMYVFVYVMICVCVCVCVVMKHRHVVTQIARRSITSLEEVQGLEGRGRRLHMRMLGEGLRSMCVHTYASNVCVCVHMRDYLVSAD